MQRTVTNLFETELACAGATTDTSTFLKKLLREITEGHTKSPVTCPWQGWKTGVGIQVLETAASVRRVQPPPAAPGKNYSVLFTSSSQVLTYTAETPPEPCLLQAESPSTLALSAQRRCSIPFTRLLVLH